MPLRLALALVLGFALAVPASAPGKGFTNVVLVASDGRSIEVRGSEREIDGLLSRRGSLERIRGGYLRLFFVGVGDFPANAGRYYPDQSCVALDWPKYERACRAIERAVAKILRPASTMTLFRHPPTVLTRIEYAAAGRPVVGPLRTPLEMALDRRGWAAARPHGCYPLTGSWRGARAAHRPIKFLLCARGVFADGRLYPLRRGVWEWFGTNIGPPPTRR